MGNTLDGCCRCHDGEFGKPVPLRYRDSADSAEAAMLEVRREPHDAQADPLHTAVQGVQGGSSLHKDPDAGHARAFLTAEISARQSWTGSQTRFGPSDKTQQPSKRKSAAIHAIPSLSSAVSLQDSAGQRPILSEDASLPRASSVAAGAPAGGGGWVLLPQRGQPNNRITYDTQEVIQEVQTRQSLQYSLPVAGKGGSARIDEAQDNNISGSTLNRRHAGPEGDDRSAPREAGIAGAATAGACVKETTVNVKGSVAESNSTGVMGAGSKQRQSQDFSDMIAAAERARYSFLPYTKAMHQRALASQAHKARRRASF